jgi:membrane-associated phospholipid phosphatase
MSGVDETRRSRDVRSRVAITVFAVAAVSFALVAEQVATRAPLIARDLQVSVWLHGHGNSSLTGFLLAVSRLHSTLCILAMALFAGLIVWRNGDRFHALWLALAVPGGLLLNVALKHLFDRPRPAWDDPILTLTSQSFPSGHATGATLFYGFVACYAVWRMKGAAARALAIAACTTMVLLVGFSRIYLGVHYLSDVLASMCLGTAWLTVCMIAARAIAGRSDAMAAA